MDNIPKSILNTLNERISSPLIGGYIISWILWNNKTVFVLLSTKSVEEKFYFINYSIYHDNLHFILSGLITPLMFSLAFIFIFPYPEKVIYKFWHARKKELIDEKQKIDGAKLLTEEKSRELKRKIIGIEAEHDKEIEKLSLEIKELKEIIKYEEKIKGTTREQITKDNIKISSFLPKDEFDDINEEEKEIIKLIALNGGSINGKLLIEKSKFDKVKTEYIIEKMQGKYTNTGGYPFNSDLNKTSLTTNGKKIAIDEGFVNDK